MAPHGDVERGVLCRCAPPPALVRAFGVVLVRPRLDQHLRLGEGADVILIHAFIPQLPVEAHLAGPYAGETSFSGPQAPIAAQQRS